mmetsp:Transcript_1895/g.6932  ORF Transcript_1895/g.6932 Transcript_1895/m.6932 type:complete len:82 (-) Transcript_1895:140-385(-)
MASKRKAFPRALDCFVARPFRDSERAVRSRPLVVEARPRQPGAESASRAAGAGERSGAANTTAPALQHPAFSPSAAATPPS